MATPLTPGLHPDRAKGPSRRAGVERLWWAVLAGTMTFLAFPFRAVPDSGLFWLGWIGLVPLMHAVAAPAVSGRRAFMTGWLMGVVTNFGGFWWVEHVLREFGHLPGWAAWSLSGVMAVYQGLQFALTAWVLARLRKPAGLAWHPLTAAAVFAGVELLFPMIFPWYLGNAQVRLPVAVQVADLAGPSGVTFVLAAANASVFAALVAARRSGPARRAGFAALVGAAAVAAAFIYGVVRIGQVDARSADAPQLRVGMVEADVGIWEKEARGLHPDDQARTLQQNLLTHQRLTASLADQGAQLVVWPESSYFPLGDLHAKRREDVAVAVTAEGRVAWMGETQAGAGGADAVSARMAFRMDASGVARPALRAVAAAREDAVVLVGDGGSAWLHDGAGFTAIDVPAGTASLRGVAAVNARGYRGRGLEAAPIRVWAVGPGTLLRGDGRRLTAMAGADGLDLRSVAALDQRVAWAVGADAEGRPAVVQAVEGAVSRVPEVEQAVPRGVGLHAVALRPQGIGVVAVGDAGTVIWTDGRRAEADALPGAEALRHVVVTSGGLVLVAGDGGNLAAAAAPGEWQVLATPLGEADLTALAEDALGGVLIAAERTPGQGEVRRLGRDGRWESPNVGLGAVTGLASLGWGYVFPLPRDASRLRPSSVALPSESDYLASPEHELRLPPWQRNAVQRAADVPVLFGGLSWEPAPEGHPLGPRLKYNTAFMLDGGGRIVGRYDKNYLLVFGEYLPFGERFPKLYELVPESGGFQPGHDVTTFPIPSHPGRRLGVMVCYEDLLPDFGRELANRGPDLLVNVTNDAWFGHTPEPYLHLTLAMLRSVETRRALVRSTNTGVSAIVDPVGRLTRQTSMSGVEAVVADVPLLDGTTVYTRVGDAFGWSCVAWTALRWVFARRRREQA